MAKAHHHGGSARKARAMQYAKHIIRTQKKMKKKMLQYNMVEHYSGIAITVSGNHCVEEAYKC